MTGPGGFLERWSRRKRGAEPDDPPAPQDEATPDEETELGPEDLAALTPVEEIDAQTDLRQYLRKGVPRALRNAALRRKWMLNAAIRDHRDIAVDYAWDWNVPGGVPGDGGPLDPDTVLRMAQRLLAPADTPPAAPVAALPQDRDAPETAPAPPPEPTAQAMAPAPAAEPAPPAERPEAPDAAPQRRHGGARPV
ncbi:DUF3306 domain-containing protein [Rhodovulum strictum]|uniref:DUF3306 domain-containing protein n=1 Tax=Rhodovulum strictum TaxID=58314 RepID=A0A844B8M8_9RHOB|nr:DUF3306 domain-containing protein [Rhodovulum strictum]MRH21970.1 DUF3306 domain-containing protein [Rhodovulum strictum]